VYKVYDIIQGVYNMTPLMPGINPEILQDGSQGHNLKTPCTFFPYGRKFQFYWYCNSTCFGQPFCRSSGVLSRTSALVYFMQFDDRFLPAPGSTRSSNLIKCTNADVRLRIPNGGQKSCPKPVELQLQ
jgi:hypothetical protein